MHSNMACFVFKLSVEACWLYIVYFILSQQKLRIMLLIVVRSLILQCNKKLMIIIINSFTFIVLMGSPFKNIIALMKSYF